MAISKLILNGDVQMDVTSDTVSANRMLNGYTATKNDGTKVTGNIATKSAADMTASGSTVTAAAGYYATATSKNVGAGSAFTPAVTITKNPTISLTSSTGAVTASYAGSSSVTPTVTAGYVAAGTAGTVSTSGTSTYQLTSKAAATYNTSTADQTVASYRWLTGTQTIKSVTTSNLTAANIAEGVVVKVGDANNASRITQITGTHSGETLYTATIHYNGNATYCYVSHNNTKYYTNGNTISFKAGDILTIYCRGNEVLINGDLVTLTNYSYNLELPSSNIDIYLSYTSSTVNDVAIDLPIFPSGAINLSAGTYNVYGYSVANVRPGTAQTPATTITTNPTFTINSTTGVITANYAGSSYITPTISSGWVSSGISGKVSTTGTSTYNLTTQAAQTIYPSTTDQTVASYRWLTGTQTFKSVTTTNLTAANIAEGVVVKVGDANNASRIVQITGTHQGGGGGFTVDQIAMRTISGSISGNATNIGSYAFGCCSSLTSVSFPSATFIDSDAFAFCYGLTSVSFPLAVSIGSSAFTHCSSLTSVSFPSATSIGSDAFIFCYSLISVSFPLVVSIGNSAFAYCRNLTSVNFPSATRINDYAFTYCSSLTSVSFPLVASISSYAFSNCRVLTSVSFPLVASIGGYAFAYCYSLTFVSFPSATFIDNFAFRNCYHLLSVYLMGSSVPTLFKSNVFSSTPISNYTTSTGGVYGSIFVPTSLYNSYITATNWSVYSARIVSV